MTYLNTNTHNRSSVSKQHTQKLRASILALRDMHIALITSTLNDETLISSFSKYYCSLLNMLDTKGEDFTRDYGKECRHLFLCFLSGNKYEPKKELRVARHRDLLPKRLGCSLVNLARTRNPVYLKHILTALFSTRNMPLSCKQPDYSTITDGSLPTLDRAFCTFVDNFVRRKH